MNAETRLVGFKRHLRAEVVSGEATYVFSELGVTALKSRHAEALAPLLDGSRSLEQLLRDLPQGLGPDECGDLLAELAQAGLVGLRAPAPGRSDDPALAYWDACGLDADAAVSGVDQGRVRLLSRTDTDDHAAADIFRQAGLSLTSDSDPAADLSVVLCDDYLDAELAEIDAAHRAAGRPWLLAKPVGTQVWIGPFFQPGLACWHCLAHRLWAHRRAEAHVQSALGRLGPADRPATTVPGLLRAGLHLIALEATKWLAGYRYSGQNEVWTVDAMTLRGRHHTVSHRPQCTGCGDPSLLRTRARQPVRLESRRKTSAGAGGHRCASAERTWEAYQHLISPITGIVKEIRRDERGSPLLNSFRSGPNLAAGAGGLDGLHAVLRAESGGKGVTAQDARVGALCEAAERYSGTFQGDEERVRGSLRSLGERAIHPDTCHLFDERQYHGRAEWNAEHAPFQRVFEPFDTDAELDWTPVWSLTEQRHRLLPTGMLYFGTPAESSRGMVRADSNGNAAGSSIEDAVLQGTLELVERDAAAIWWYNRTRQPGVDLAAFAEPWIDDLRAVHAGLRREVWVLDLTSDLGIPTMVALSRRTDRTPEDIMFGFGSHLDPHMALRRALTELNQMMPTVTREDRADCGDPDAEHWWRHATTANQPYLLPDTGRRPLTPEDYRYTPRTDLRADVDHVHAELARIGMNVLVVDQTRPDIGMPVVKMIVPGLRHFWARLGPGRLFDVPVRLGRRATPTPYADLNPFPLFV